MIKDAIIVLGGGIEADGSLPSVPKLRVVKGAELFKEGVASRMILSGNYGFWFSQELPKSEAEAMKEYAISLGVPKEAILKEDVSKDTIGNAYFCRLNFLEPNNWKNIAVITSEYHMPRAQYIFEKVLGGDYKVQFISVDSRLTAEDMIGKIDKENKTMIFLKKWFDSIRPGNMEEIKNLIYTKHPGYAENPEVTKEQLLKMLGRG